MKSYFLPVVLAFIEFGAIAQTTPAKPRTKILLLGSTHFTPSTQDVNKGASVDLTTPQRQPQVQAVVQQLVAFHPQQIFVEQPVAIQPRLDSLYRAYQQGRYTLRSNEIDQLAFQAARQLQLPGVRAVNYLRTYAKAGFEYLEG